MPVPDPDGPPERPAYVVRAEPDGKGFYVLHHPSGHIAHYPVQDGARAARHMSRPRADQLAQQLTDAL